MGVSVTASASISTQAFGALSAQVKDQMYLVRRGYLYASPWVVTETTRFSASILMTAHSAPLELSIGEHTQAFQAVAVKPLILRRVQAQNVHFISVGISPNHPHYRKFRAIGCPGYVSLPREAYIDFDAAFAAAYSGKFSINDAVQLFEDVVDVTIPYLPRIRRADPRIERALEMLQENSQYPLQDLAAAVGLSYDRMSHLFAETVGLPLRSYLLWQKIHIASSLFASGLKLTEIAAAAGFTDSAHLANTWQKAYGSSPSYFINSGKVEIHSVALDSGVSTRIAQAVARSVNKQSIAERESQPAKKRDSS